MLTRRKLLKGAALSVAGMGAATLASCQPAVVKETVVVEKVVKETVVVEKAAEIVTIRHMLRAGDLGPRYDRAIVEFSNSHPNMKAKIEPVPGGDSEYVLAAPGRAWVAWSGRRAGEMGVRGLPAGSYALRWLDCVRGAIVEQAEVAVAGGDTTWSAPVGIGSETALYVERVD